MKLLLKILLLVFVANVKVASATIVFPDFQKTTTSFSFYIETPKTIYKVIKNDEANCCQNGQDLVDYRGWGDGTEAVAAKGGTTGFRYITEGELKAIQQSGMLRGGNPGKTYFTKDLYKSGAHAQQRLSLPTTPTLRVEFEILNNPTMRLNGSKVLPDFGMPGKGAEFMTTDPVKVRLINWQPLR
jgi:hypothetical protein